MAEAAIAAVPQYQRITFDKAVTTAGGTSICLCSTGNNSLANVAIQSREELTLVISIWFALRTWYRTVTATSDGEFALIEDFTPSMAQIFCETEVDYPLRNLILLTLILTKSPGSILLDITMDNIIAPSFFTLPWVGTINFPGLSAG